MLKEPPRSSQSVHRGTLSDGAAENVAGRSLGGFGGGVVARAVGREIRNRPVPRKRAYDAGQDHQQR